MRMHNLITRRPGKNCETAILRSYQGKRIPLIINKLRGRKVACTAILAGSEYLWVTVDDRFGYHDLSYGFTAVWPGYFGAEGQEFVPVVNYRCAVHSG